MKYSPMNETEVGTITLLPGDRTLFVFSESYVENPARPTLSLSFKTPFGDLRTEEKIRGQAKLPPFFSNLLPEGTLRDYIAKELHISANRDFPLITALGADLPGAVIVDSVQHTSEKFDNAEKIDPSLTMLRFSLAGVQLKFSVRVNDRGDLEIPFKGVGGNWIAKLPSPRFEQVPEAEYSMLSLAKKVGLDVPDFKLISTSKIQGIPEEFPRSNEESLLVKRFDRGEHHSRIHMEDFAQVFDMYPENKYEQSSFDRINSDGVWRARLPRIH